MHTLIAALTYFFLVFAVGFALALIRIPFLVPRLGERWAELLELPFMLLASFLAARWLVERFVLVTAGQRIGAGFIALTIMVLAELTLTVAMGQPVVDYVAGRDPVSGPAYLVSLLLFALMPLLVGHRSGAHPH